MLWMNTYPSIQPPLDWPGPFTVTLKGVFSSECFFQAPNRAANKNRAYTLISLKGLRGEMKCKKRYGPFNLTEHWQQLVNLFLSATQPPAHVCSGGDGPALWVSHVWVLLLHFHSVPVSNASSCRWYLKLIQALVHSCCYKLGRIAILPRPKIVLHYHPVTVGSPRYKSTLRSRLH